MRMSGPQLQSVHPLLPLTWIQLQSGKIIAFSTSHIQTILSVMVFHEDTLLLDQFKLRYTQLFISISDMLIDLCEGSTEVGSHCGRILGTGAVLQTAGQRALEVREEAYAFLSKGLKDERAAVKSASCRSYSHLIFQNLDLRPSLSLSIPSYLHFLMTS